MEDETETEKSPTTTRVILLSQKQSYGIRVEIVVHGMDYNLITEHWSEFLYGMHLYTFSFQIPMNLSSSLRWNDLHQVIQNIFEIISQIGPVY
ncbi:hypothetical protein H5410_001031 [Solanum commersonii]|uniref:Uncharacterized protein n=1 Tax=Solanum commersonii TaxID=4109 RepID=A0A9J6AYF8_SOLCO|nr:hypothetical protein H5410_001031 [Solanum commersonii]